MKRWIKDIYIDVLNKGHQIEAVWLGDMLVFKTWRDLGGVRVYGHTIYVNAGKKIIEWRHEGTHGITYKPNS